MQHINFSVDPQSFPTQVEARSQSILQRVDQLSQQPPSWQQIMPELEHISEEFEEYAGVYGHVKSVADNDQLRQAYKSALPTLSRYHTAMGQHQGLYKSLRAIDTSELSLAQKSALEQQIRAFELSGVHLDKDQRSQFAEMRARKSELSNSFSENLLDSTQSYTRPLSAQELKSVDAPIRKLLATNAKSRQHSGHLATLDAPIVLALLRNSSNRELRAELHYARLTRASKLADSKFDNDANMLQILQLRRQLAELAGYPSLADYLLCENILRSGEQVMGFIEQMFARVGAAAQRDHQRLQQFAQEHLQIEQLQSWDSAFVQEQMSKQLFDFNEEQLRPYFPIDHVLPTVLNLLGKLFDFRVSPVDPSEFSQWHPDVQLVKLQRGGQDLGFLYIDLYARAHKNGGAWMNEGRTRRLVAGTMQLPVAYLICNFRAPEDGGQALLSIDELDTLLHESGHCLHHLLSEVDVAAVNGLRGVPMDGIEVPSQFMEYLMAHRSIFAQLSRHHQSGAALDEQTMARIEAKRNFCKALFVNQQLQYAAFDARLHIDSAAITSSDDIHQLWQGIRKQHSPFPPCDYDMFPNGFGHIFAGGYALGYYSYLYSEIQSADAFAYIAGGDGSGSIDKSKAQSFARKVLARGSERPFDQLYASFRGQAAEPTAYLQLNGLQQQ